LIIQVILRISTRIFPAALQARLPKTRFSVWALLGLSAMVSQSASPTAWFEECEQVKLVFHYRSAVLAAKSFAVNSSRSRRTDSRTSASSIAGPLTAT